MSEETKTGSKTGKISKYVVAKVSDIQPGGRMIFDIDGRSIGVFNIRGKFYGILNRCPHLGGPLCVGDVVPNIRSEGQGDMQLDESTTWITCPWHNWEFDISTGQSYWNPTRLKARPFTVQVEEGEVVVEEEDAGVVGRVKGPYQAETIDVSVEEHYVVVSLKPVRPGQQVRPAGPADRPAADQEIA